MSLSKTKIQLIHIPDPNTASIKVNTEAEALVIEYPTLSAAKVAQIRFNHFSTYSYGEPNDEGFFVYYKEVFDYPALGFEFNSLYKVKDLENEFGLKYKGLLENTSNRHYIFFVKEGTFQCIAQEIELPQ